MISRTFRREDIPQTYWSAGDGALVNFGAFPFTVESAFGAVSVETPRLVQDRGPFSVTLKLASPAQDGYSAKVELMDAPYRNVWFSKTLPLEAGKKELSFDLENYRMPTIGGYLRCTVYDARGNAAHAENPVIFPGLFPGGLSPAYLGPGWLHLQPGLRGTDH